MNWTTLAISGLILTFFAHFIFHFRSQARKRRRNFGDTKIFREALVKWEAVVLEHDKTTLRDVKRFANRARFLMADEHSNESVLLLLGFVALEEINFVDSSVNDFDIQKWRQGTFPRLVKSGLSENSISMVDNWLTEIEKAEQNAWMCYRALTTGAQC